MSRFKTAIGCCLTLGTILLAIGISGVAWAGWVSDGNPLSLATGNQVSAQVVSDGAQGAIVVWEDLTSGDIYAQRVDASGNLMWATDGISLCSDATQQHAPQAISDGAGGAIVVWEDGRGVIDPNYPQTPQPDVYIQRVDGAGNVLWTTDGVVVSAGWHSQWDPRITSDGAGGAIVTWRDTRTTNLDVYAQRVDAAGNTLWTADGVLLCSNPFTQNYPVPVGDGAGGAIVVWEDHRAVGDGAYAQHVNASGNLLWGASGVGLGSLGAQRPDIVTDGAGGAIAAWSDTRIFGNRDIYVQRVDASGNVLWTPDGVPICLSTGDQVDVQLTPDGAGGAVLAWQDQRVGPPDIYAQRVNATGNAVWTPNGAPVCTATDGQYAPHLVSDGNGGAAITWYDRRAGLNNYNIYAQQIDALGNPACVFNGVAVCAATGDQLLPQLAIGAGGAIIAWHDRRVSDVNIYAREFILCENPVPVTFTSFRAEATDDAVLLRWITSHDEDFEGYRVYRATGDAGFVNLASHLLPVSTDSYRDSRVVPGGVYRYMVAAVASDGSEMMSPIVTARVTAATLALHGNRPNPFNPTTTISYSVPSDMKVQVEIFDVHGALVTTLYAGNAVAGYHELPWNGQRGDGGSVSSGIYWCRLRAGNQVMTSKMVLVQ